MHEVSPDNDYTFSSEEPPITARIVLKKVDAETGAPAAQGDATLDGRSTRPLSSGAARRRPSKGRPPAAPSCSTACPSGRWRSGRCPPSDGYLLDREVHRIEVTAEMAQAGDAVIEVSPEGEFGELVQRGGLIIGKGDAERYEHEGGTFWNYAQGDAHVQKAPSSRFTTAPTPPSGTTGTGTESCRTARWSTPTGSSRSYRPSTTPPSTPGPPAPACARAALRHPEVVETKAPEGYTGEGIVSHVVEIREDGQFDQLVEADGILNEVVRGGVQVQKNDLELGESEGLGGADHSSLADDRYLGTSLEGIGFTITNVSEHGVMVGGTYYPTGSVVAVIETAWNPEAQAYTAQTASDALPYGTHTVAETATNESYLLTDGEPRTFEVRGDGIVVTSDVDGGALLWSDQVVRHDMHLQKKGTVHGEKLGLVPFLITNVTTGEAHVAVTDRNGMLSTSSEWRSREESVNANDALIYEDYIDSEDIVEGSGIWFGTGEHGSQAAPDDSSARFPTASTRSRRCAARRTRGTPSGPTRST